MKRRDFLKTTSLSVPIAAAGQKLLAQTDSPFFYPSAKTFEEIKTKEGETLVRLKFSSHESKSQTLHKGNIKVENATVIAITPHSFESTGDIFDPIDQTFSLYTNSKKADILLVRLKEVSAESSVHILNNKTELSFKLAEIFVKGYLELNLDDTKIDANFLLDKEIGEISLSEIGVQKNPDKFNFHIFADPQGGDPASPRSQPTRMKIHNAFIEDSIILSNHLPDRPLFSLILGDIVDSQGEPENFEVMQKMWDNLDSPILYELGNHESEYSATFEPGYDMSAFQNFFNAQKIVNGMDKILYSFNVGQWHFVVWPDPLRNYFWDNHPHYFEWLERDLEKHKNRPTMVFQHCPVHPIGISPFQGYLDYVSVRKKFVDTVTKFDNVKYVLSGHVHTPVKSSLKTACSIKGTNFITLPAAGFRPRGFGEEDYFGGPSQGIAIIKIGGKKAQVMFKTVMEEELVFPEKCPKFDHKKHSLWFNEKWEIDAPSQIANGHFKNNLDDWAQEYIYVEDENPSVICEQQKIDNRTAVYLYNHIRGYQAPGQDRLPQTINRMSTAVSVKPGTTPILNFSYKLDKDNCDLDGINGGYVWIEGYDKTFRQFNLVYSAGTAFASPIAKWTERNHDIHHFNLPDNFNWSDVQLNIADDFNTSEKERKYEKLNIDRIVITMGVWHINEGKKQPFGIYFTNFKTNHKNSTKPSMVNKKQIEKKSPDKIWWRGKHIPFIHLAGEHRYHLETAKETLFKKEHERHINLQPFKGKK